MQQISHDTFTLSYTGHNDLLLKFLDEDIETFCKDRGECGGVEQIQYTTTNDKSGSKKLIKWGRNNKLPQARENLIMDNNIVGTLIANKRNYSVGSGLIAYKEVFENGECRKEQVAIPADIDNWLNDNMTNQFMSDSCGEMYKHANIFTEFVPTKSGMIDSTENMESKYMRCTEKNKNGNVTSYLWSGSWTNDYTDSNKKDRIEIAAYNKKEKSKRKFIYHTGDRILNDGYYFIPVWWGGRKWIVLANCIPEFHLSNLKHGYTLRYHIQIPKSYFYDFSTIDGEPTADQLNVIKQDAEGKKQEFITALNAILGGQKNAGRSVVSTYDINKELGQAYPGIKIEPISSEIYDEKLLKLFESSNQANISAQGIHPTLANIETQGKLSSGSEMRNALIVYLATQNIPRRILLEPLQIVRRLNNWDNIEGFNSKIKFGFKDTLITTLDEDKSGTKEKI